MNKSGSSVLQYNTEGLVMYWYCYFLENEIPNTRKNIAIPSIILLFPAQQIQKHKVEDMNLRREKGPMIIT